VEGDLLLIFKSTRRDEYHQENLRILSASFGDRMDTSFAERWIDPALDPHPTPGERVLIVLCDPPYEKSRPVRFATVTAASRVEGTIALNLTLAERAWASDMDRWNRLVASGPAPVAGAFIARRAMDSDTAAALSVPNDRDSKIWRRTVETLGRWPGYARSVFLRVGAVSLVGSDATLDPPIMLVQGEDYQLQIESYNPHLEAEALRDTRLVTFHDPLTAQLAIEEGDSVPADGVVDAMLEPLEIGETSFDVTVARGSSFQFGLRIHWQTMEAPLQATIAAHQPQSDDTGAESEWATTVPLQVGAAPIEGQFRQSVPDPESVVARQLAIGRFARVRPGSRRPDAGDVALRAYLRVRDQQGITPELRLQILGDLVTLAPNHARLAEELGLALFDAGKYREAAALLEAVGVASMGPDGRMALIAGQLRIGRLPEPIALVGAADLSRDDVYAMVLDASSGLTPPDQVALGRHLAETVLSDDRASRWIDALMTREIGTQERWELVDLWKYVDPDRAGQALERMLEEGVLDLVDGAAARHALDLGIVAGRAGLARLGAYALIDWLIKRSDLTGLEGLMQEVLQKLPGEDRDEVGEQICRKLMDAAHEDERIDGALDGAMTVLDDYRKRGDLEAAARLGQLVAANRHRAGAAVQSRADHVLATLEEVLTSTETIRLYEAERRRAANADLRAQLADRRLLLVGGKRAVWWLDLRRELGLHERSEWIESELRKAPSADRLEETLKRGQWAAIVVLTGRIGHKVSNLITDQAKVQDIPIIEVARPSRDAFLTALRRQFAPANGS
jgi:hypothetical protein